MGVLDNQDALVTVVNTVVDTDLARFTIPDRLLKTTSGIILEAEGDYLNNTGAGQNYIPYALMGSTVFFNGAGNVLMAPATSADRGVWSVRISVFNKNALNAQVGKVVLTTKDGAAGGPLTAAGAPFNNMQYVEGQHHSLAVNTEVTFPIAFRIILGVANANLDMRCLTSRLIVVP